MPHYGGKSPMFTVDDRVAISNSYDGSIVTTKTPATLINF